MESPRPSKRSAALQIAGVALLLGGWYLLLALGGVGERIEARSRALAIVVQVGGNALLGLTAVAIGLRVSRQRWRDIGLGRAPVLATLGWGLVGLFAVYILQAVIVGALLGSGVLVWLPAQDITGHLNDKKNLAEQFSVLPLASLVPIAVVVGIYEEVVFRGFLLSRVGALFGAEPIGARPVGAELGGAQGPTPRRRRWLVAVVVLVTALAFGAGHAYQGVVGVLQTTIVALGLGWLVVMRRSVWPAIVAHACIDTIGLLVARFADKLLP